MQKTLSVIALGTALLAVAGCSPERIPGVYKIDIQQGNVVDQEMVDQLRPGMEKRQVRYVMGTPLLVDVFHQERWDYVFTFQPGGKKMTEKRVSLFFDRDRLVRVTGDYRPSPEPRAAPERVEQLVEVPVRPPERKGFFRRIWEKIGFGGSG